MWACILCQSPQKQASCQCRVKECEFSTARFQRIEAFWGHLELKHPGVYNMYIPGYRFQTYAPVDEKRRMLPFFLYDRKWDHSKTPAENMVERLRVVELTDGITVEVVRNDNGSIFVKLDTGEEGYLG